MINYTFLKSPGEFKYAKIFAKFSKKKFYLRKTENLQNLFQGTHTKIDAKFICKQ